MCRRMRESWNNTISECTSLFTIKWWLLCPRIAAGEYSLKYTYVCTCSEPMFLILLFDIFVIYLELCWARYVLLYVLLNVLYLQSVSN